MDKKVYLSLWVNFCAVTKSKVFCMILIPKRYIPDNSICNFPSKSDKLIMSTTGIKVATHCCLNLIIVNDVEL